MLLVDSAPSSELPSYTATPGRNPLSVGSLGRRLYAKMRDICRISGLIVKEALSVAIQYVLMDVDGVVVPGPGMRFARLLKEKYHLTEVATAPFFLGPFQECLVGKADLRLVLGPYLRRWQWPGREEDFMDEWFRCEHQLNEAVLTIMDRLRAGNVAVYLATNQEAARTQYLLQAMGLNAHVDGVFASCTVGAIKPTPHFFESIWASLDMSPAEGLLWDDSESIVLKAQSLGLHAELFRDTKQFLVTMAHFFPWLNITDLVP